MDCYHWPNDIMNTVLCTEIIPYDSSIHRKKIVKQHDGKYRTINLWSKVKADTIDRTKIISDTSKNQYHNRGARSHHQIMNIDHYVPWWLIDY